MAALMVLAIVVAACVPHPSPPRDPPREKFEPEPDFWWREA